MSSLQYFLGRRQRRITIAFVLLLLLTVPLLLLIAQQIFVYRSLPFDLDEAGHANGGLALLLGWRAEGLRGIGRAFFEQGFYPPGFAWVQALAFALFGVSTVVARYLSAAAFFLTVLVVYALSVQIDRRHGYLAGLVAGGLLLTSWPLLINAGLVMKETPGLLSTFLMLLAYVRALQKPTRGRFLLVSFLFMLTFLVKYTYGVAAVLTLLAMEFSLLLEQRGTANCPQSSQGRLLCFLQQRWLWLVGPFILLLFVWLILGENLSGFLAYATAQPPGSSWLTRESLLFYPQVIVDDYLPAPFTGVLLVGGLIWAAAYWHLRPARLLLIYFLVGMAIMVINMPKAERFIATFVPAAHVLAGLSVSWLLGQRASSLQRRASAVGLILVVGLLLSSVPSFARRLATYPSALRVAYETDPELRDLALWLEEQIPAGQEYIMVNYWDQFGPQTANWNRGIWLGLPRQVYFSEVAVSGLLIEPASPERIAVIRDAIEASDACYLVLFEGAPWGTPFWPEYTAALHDQLRQMTEQTFTIARPAASGPPHQYTIKAIVYELEGHCS